MNCSLQAPDVAVVEDPWWMLKVEGYMLTPSGEIPATRSAVLGNLIRRIVVNVDPAAIEPVRSASARTVACDAHSAICSPSVAWVASPHSFRTCLPFTTRELRRATQGQPPCGEWAKGSDAPLTAGFSFSRRGSVETDCTIQVG